MTQLLALIANQITGPVPAWGATFVLLDGPGSGLVVASVRKDR